MDVILILDLNEKLNTCKICKGIKEYVHSKRQNSSTVQKE